MDVYNSLPFFNLDIPRTALNPLERFLHLLQTRGNLPVAWGNVHVMAILLAALLTVFLCIAFRSASEKAVRRLLFFFWLCMFCLEVLKQFCYSCEIGATGTFWDYQWYAFPFQFCSSPLYLLPLAVFLKNGKVRNAVLDFLAVYSLFAGVSVFFYPNGIFTTVTFINYQSLIHHGLQIVIGLFLLFYYRRKLDLHFFLRGTVVFVVLLTTAVLMNLLAPFFTKETFNMFYISPYWTCGLPVLDTLQRILPYPLFLLSYIFGFAAVSFILFTLLYSIYYFFVRRKAEGRKRSVPFPN